MSLKKYLNAPINSTVKETIFNYRLFHDIKIAAATNNNDVQIYVPEIDRKGFDIILDDNDTLKMIQIKTIGEITYKSSWDIHKSIIRPNPLLSKLVFNDDSPATTGKQGGVILIHPVLSSDHKTINSVEYYYTDFIIITCFLERIITKYMSSQKKAKALLKELVKGKSNHKIEIPIHLFVKTKNPASLLALCDMHSNQSSTYLSTSVVNYLKSKEGEKEYISKIKEFIKNVTDDENLRIDL